MHQEVKYHQHTIRQPQAQVYQVHEQQHYQQQQQAASSSQQHQILVQQPIMHPFQQQQQVLPPTQYIYNQNTGTFSMVKSDGTAFQPFSK